MCIYKQKRMKRLMMFALLMHLLLGNVQASALAEKTDGKEEKQFARPSSITTALQKMENRMLVSHSFDKGYTVNDKFFALWLLQG